LVQEDALKQIAVSAHSPLEGARVEVGMAAGKVEPELQEEEGKSVHESLGEAASVVTKVPDGRTRPFGYRRLRWNDVDLLVILRWLC
jgi:hypothetical protein